MIGEKIRMLNDLVVAISGGAGRIGSVFSKAIVDNGGKVIIGDISEQNGKQLIQEFGLDRSLFIKSDITKPDQIENFIKVGLQKFDHIDAAIHCSYPRSKKSYTTLETLKEKPSYRNLIKKKRCIIIADGYFEWMSTNSGKQPYYIQSSDHQILYLAGLWEQWFNANNESYTSCTIITKEAVKKIESIHSRMPAILPIEKVEQWIDYNFSIINHQQFLSRLKENIDFHKISTFVNNTINNTPECILPIREE